MRLKVKRRNWDFVDFCFALVFLSFTQALLRLTDQKPRERQVSRERCENRAAGHEISLSAPNEITNDLWREPRRSTVILKGA